MKTYCSEEMVGYPEIVEWVPADVARELYSALYSVHSEAKSEFAMYRSSDIGVEVEQALRKACNK